MESSNSRRIGFVSLGCPKALVDSERILTQLKIDGYDIVQDYQSADLVVVNTCGFIDSAKQESLATIGEAITENGRVLVTGCLGVQKDEIKNAHPAVLDISGPQQYEHVVGAVHEHAPLAHVHDPHVDLVPAQGIKLTPRHYAYLKISEGCNHKCKFCIIPSMRGKLASRKVDDVLMEAEGLVKAGVRELLIISQDTSAYGSDISYEPSQWRGKEFKTSFMGLCEGLSELGIWIRLHYVYPYPHVDDVIPMMAEGKILPYLDIPFQHGSEKILKSMRRPAAAENTLKRIASWREICPELAIRSTFIVGFPGETEQDFDILLDFLQEAQLDRVGCFQYSAVEGATANELPDPVPEAIKEERWHRFMQCQAEISQKRLADKVGATLDVMIDDKDGTDYVGRCYADAPEIDGNVFVESGAEINIGQVVPVRITESGDYDLWGKLLDD